MKTLAVFSLSLFSILAVAQTDITKVFTISPTLYDLGTAILPAGDGYAVFGYQASAGSATTGEIFMLRIDKDCQEISRHLYGTPNRREFMGRGVVAVGNNGWLIAGSQMNGSASKGYLLRVDANGTLLWSKTVTEIATLTITSVVSLPSGDFIFAGGSGTFNETLVVRMDDSGN